MPTNWCDAEGYGYRAMTQNEFETQWPNGMWTYVVDHHRAKEAFTKAMEELADITPDHSLVLAFGSTSNFRYGVFPQYKSNRRKYRKPAGLRDFYLWIRDNWVTQSYEGVEGDDVIGINVEEGDVISSLDKDLKTIPGVHIERGGLIDISQYEADHAFYMQVLSGDASDGYPGCPGVGPKRAADILKNAKTSEEMWAATLEAYEKKHLSREYALQMARCARILRVGEYDLDNERPLLWQPPE
jgi:DNA polymerase-1